MMKIFGGKGRHGDCPVVPLIEKISRYFESSECLCMLFLCIHAFYKKPSSRSNAKSFLILGHILVLKFS